MHSSSTTPSRTISSNMRSSLSHRSSSNQQQQANQARKGRQGWACSLQLAARWRQGSGGLVVCG